MTLLAVNMVADRSFGMKELIKMPKKDLAALIKKFGLEEDYNADKMKVLVNNGDRGNSSPWFVSHEPITGL